METNRETREGDNGLFITLVPKVFLFAGLTTLGTFIGFWMVRLLSIAVVKPTNKIENAVKVHKGVKPTNKKKKKEREGEREHFPIYYTSPQRLK